MSVGFPMVPASKPRARSAAAMRRRQRPPEPASRPGGWSAADSDSTVGAFEFDGRMSKVDQQDRVVVAVTARLCHGPVVGQGRIVMVSSTREYRGGWLDGSTAGGTAAR